MSCARHLLRQGRRRRRRFGRYGLIFLFVKLANSGEFLLGG
jgi:hypothetical protein